MRLKLVRTALLAAITIILAFGLTNEEIKADDGSPVIQETDNSTTGTDSAVSGGAVETVSPGAVNATGGAVTTPGAVDLENSDETETVPDIEVLDEFTVGKLFYMVTEIKNDKIYVAVTGVANDSTTTVHIPKMIKYKNRELTVTSIGEDAFSYLERLRKVVINAGITRIDRDAFKGAVKLSRLIIKTDSLKKVGKNIFKNVSNKLSIEVPKKSLGNYNKLFKNKGTRVKEIKAIKNKQL